MQPFSAALILFPNASFLSLALHLSTCPCLYIIHIPVRSFHAFLSLCLAPSYIRLFIVLMLFSKLFQVVVFSFSLSQWCVAHLLSTPISLYHSSAGFYSLRHASHSFTYKLTLYFFPYSSLYVPTACYASSQTLSTLLPFVN